MLVWFVARKRMRYRRRTEKAHHDPNPSDRLDATDDATSKVEIWEVKDQPQSTNERLLASPPTPLVR